MTYDHAHQMLVGLLAENDCESMATRAAAILQRFPQLVTAAPRELSNREVQAFADRYCISGPVSELRVLISDAATLHFVPENLKKSPTP